MKRRGGGGGACDGEVVVELCVATTTAPRAGYTAAVATHRDEEWGRRRHDGASAVEGSECRVVQ